MSVGMGAPNRLAEWRRRVRGGNGTACSDAIHWSDFFVGHVPPEIATA
jgi:hypothetical protein